MESSKISIPSASHLAVCMQHICTQKQIKVTLAELLQICSIIYIRDTAYCTSPPPISIRNRHAFSLRFYKTSALHPIGNQADQTEGQVQDMGKGSQIVDSNLVLPHLSNELPGKTTLGYVEAWSAALQGRPKHFVETCACGLFFKQQMCGPGVGSVCHTSGVSSPCHSASPACCTHKCATGKVMSFLLSLVE